MQSIIVIISSKQEGLVSRREEDSIGTIQTFMLMGIDVDGPSIHSEPREHFQRRPIYRGSVTVGIESHPTFRVCRDSPS